MHTKFERLLSKSLTTMEVMTYYLVVHTGPEQTILRVAILRWKLQIKLPPPPPPQLQYADTGPTSPSADPIMPGTWQGSHWSANFQVNGMTRPGQIPLQAGFESRIFRSRGGRISHKANEVVRGFEDSGGRLLAATESAKNESMACTCLASNTASGRTRKIL